MRAFVGAVDIDGEDTGAPVPFSPNPHPFAYPQLAPSFWLVNCGVKRCVIKWQSKQVLFGCVTDLAGESLWRRRRVTQSHKTCGAIGRVGWGGGGVVWDEWEWWEHNSEAMKRRREKPTLDGIKSMFTRLQFLWCFECVKEGRESCKSDPFLSVWVQTYVAKSKHLSKFI